MFRFILLHGNTFNNGGLDTLRSLMWIMPSLLEITLPRIELKVVVSQVMSFVNPECVICFFVFLCCFSHTVGELVGTGPETQRFYKLSI